MVAVCLYGLYDMDWGTQLYIQMLENVIIFACVTWAGIWEQRKQSIEYLADYKHFRSGKLNVMSALEDDDMPEFSKTKEHLLSAADMNKIFTERKLDELLEDFGARKCRSFYDLNRPVTDDPRRVKTWPCSPQEVGPILPLPDPYPDNCYVVGLNEQQMQQMKFLSK